MSVSGIYCRTGMSYNVGISCSLHFHLPIQSAVLKEEQQRRTLQLANVSAWPTTLLRLWAIVPICCSVKKSLSPGVKTATQAFHFITTGSALATLILRVMEAVIEIGIKRTVTVLFTFCSLHSLPFLKGPSPENESFLEVEGQAKGLPYYFILTFYQIDSLDCSIESLLTPISHNSIKSICEIRLF